MLEWVHVLCIICMHACMCTLCAPLFLGYVTVAKSVSGFIETSGELERTHTHTHTHLHQGNQNQPRCYDWVFCVCLFCFVCFSFFVMSTNVANGSPKMCGAWHAGVSPLALTTIWRYVTVTRSATSSKHQKILTRWSWPPATASSENWSTRQFAPSESHRLLCKMFKKHRMRCL